MRRDPFDVTFVSAEFQSVERRVSFLEGKEGTLRQALMGKYSIKLGVWRWGRLSNWSSVRLAIFGYKGTSKQFGDILKVEVLFNRMGRGFSVTCCFLDPGGVGGELFRVMVLVESRLPWPAVSYCSCPFMGFTFFSGFLSPSVKDQLPWSDRQGRL